MSYRTPDAGGTPSTDPEASLSLRADFRGTEGASILSALSLSTLPSQWDKLVSGGVGKKELQPPPHSEVQAKPQTGLSLSVWSWLQSKDPPGLAESGLSTFLCPHSPWGGQGRGRALLHPSLPKQLAVVQPPLT